MKQNTSKLTITALFAAMITLMTAYICHIPYGVNGGYIHFGDALIYIAAVLLPRPYAMAAAAVGGGLADLLTAPMWAPATILIKLAIILPFTNKNSTLLCTRNVIAPFISAVLSAIGYYLAEGILFGSFLSPIASIAGSAVQSGGSAVIFIMLALVLDKAHIKPRTQRILNSGEQFRK